MSGLCDEQPLDSRRRMAYSLGRGHQSDQEKTHPFIVAIAEDHPCPPVNGDDMTFGSSLLDCWNRARPTKRASGKSISDWQCAGVVSNMRTCLHNPHLPRICGLVPPALKCWLRRREEPKSFHTTVASAASPFCHHPSSSCWQHLTRSSHTHIISLVLALDRGINSHGKPKTARRAKRRLIRAIVAPPYPRQV